MKSGARGPGSESRRKREATEISAGPLAISAKANGAGPSGAHAPLPGSARASISISRRLDISWMLPVIAQLEMLSGESEIDVTRPRRASRLMSALETTHIQSLDPAMAKKQDQVAKARILVIRDDGCWSLLSRKRSGDERKHGKLEMLGGRLDGKEFPFEALIRELREEEETGKLASYVERHSPSYQTKVAGRATHHLFEVTLPNAKYEQLKHHPRESLGFELLPTSELNARQHWKRLTYRTRKILEAFGPAPAEHDCLRGPDA